MGARTHVPNPDCIVALANEKVASFAIPGRGGALSGNTETHVPIEGATRGSSRGAAAVSRKDRDRGDYPFDNFVALSDGSVCGMFRTLSYNSRMTI